MLRRVARVLRVGLFIAGMLLLVWSPISLFVVLLIWIPVMDPGRIVVLHIESGNLGFLTEKMPPAFFDFDVTVERDVAPDLHPFSEFYWLRFSGTEFFVWIPLWLLALICLAWPVTSFIIHRRRHRRGFPVEPKGVGDSVNASAS